LVNTVGLLDLLPITSLTKELATEDNKLVAVLCPAQARRIPKSQSEATDIERAIAKWILDGCTKSTTIVVLTTSPAREQPDDFHVRMVSTSADSKGPYRKLEHGRMLTSFAASIVERAVVDDLHVVCFTAPREPVLSRETLDSFFKVVETCSLFESCRERVMRKRQEIIKDAIRSDEVEARRYEPEGMYM